MTRKIALDVLRIAGYHNDSKIFVRTYVENRISLAAANKEWRLGQSMKTAGAPCSCRDCARVAA